MTDVVAGARQEARQRSCLYCAAQLGKQFVDFPFAKVIADLGAL